MENINIISVEKDQMKTNGYEIIKFIEFNFKQQNGSNDCQSE